MEDSNRQNNLSNKNSLFLYSTSLIFEQNINELWYFLRDSTNEVKITDYFDNLKFIYGDNTWTIGNTFSINWLGITRLEKTCVDIKANINKKIIKWKTKGDIGINYYKKIILYKITQNDKTLVKIIISRTEKKNELIEFDSMKKYYSNLIFNNLLKQSDYLNNRKEDIISYHSCIINENYKKVWEFMIDLKKLSEIIPAICKKVEYNGSFMKVGNFIKYYFEKLKITVFLKIIEIDMPKKKKTWIYKLETIGTFTSSLPKYIECKVIIINDNKTQLSFLHKFTNDSDKDFIKYFNDKKMEVIYDCKQYFEKGKKI